MKSKEDSYWSNESSRGSFGFLLTARLSDSCTLNFIIFNCSISYSKRELLEISDKISAFKFNFKCITSFVIYNSLSNFNSDLNPITN